MKTRAPYQAVVMGASAGGLQAVWSVIGALPTGYALPILLVQHRDQRQRHLLEEVLQSKCAMRVRQAEEKEPILPGNLYVAPPGYHLMVESDRTIALTADPPVRFSRPSIDVLFESASWVYGRALVSVVLTGANNDGSDGTVAVHQHGGLTVAQDPAEALFPVMPQSAIATGCVHQVLTLQEISQLMQSWN